MDWLFLGGLGMIWVALLLAPNRAGAFPRDSIRDFERGMQMLADTEQHPGRWVLVPSKDERFLGSNARAYVRARDRRRAIFTVWVEALGLTLLIGLFPPLRLFWIGSALLAVGLIAYVGLLLKLKAEFEADLARAPRQAVPIHQEREILENELRILQKRREAEARRAIAEPAFELPANVRVFAAR